MRSTSALIRLHNPCALTSGSWVLHQVTESQENLRTVPRANQQKEANTWIWLQFRLASLPYC
jgi:hypothetical protein